MSQFYQGVVVGDLPPSVPTLFTENSGTATPVSNNLNVLGGTGVNTTGLGSTITIDVVTGGFSWLETDVDLGISDQVGVFCLDPIFPETDITISLPTTASIQLGSSVYIYADTASPVVIQANAGQFIEIGGSTSSSAGTATSNSSGNLVILVFRPNDSTWHSFSSIGTWTNA